MQQEVIISIVTFNNSKIIGETLKSLLDHITGITYKIIIYDNNSTDSTLEIISEINSDRIEVMKNYDNRGFGYGHNQIFKNYDANYYVIYNPDLRVKNNIIKELFGYMENNKDIAMITPKVRYPNGEIQYLCKKDPTLFDLALRRFIPKILKKYFQKRIDDYEMRQTGYDKVFTIPYATGCFMFFRGEILKRINGFDDKFFMYLEDADITRRANRFGRCVFYPYNFVEHLWERGSHKSLYLTWINIKSAIYYFNKWGWRFW